MGRSQPPGEPTVRRARREGTNSSLGSHAMLCGAALLLWVYFFLLNRTTVTGRQRLRIEPNTLLVSNHQSSMDSFLIALGALFPRCLFRPWMMPWNLAAEEHFYRTPLRAWFSDHLRCIPVRRGIGDPSALRRWMTSLRRGVGIFYPEGRRSPDGTVGDAGPGVGIVILATRPYVVPVAIEGMREVVRFDRFGLRFFRRIDISFGEPIEFMEESPATGSRGREEARRVAAVVMERVRRHHADLCASMDRP